MGELSVKDINESKREISPETSLRKIKHIQICLEDNVETRKRSTGLEDINFLHLATTDLNFDDIDLTTSLFGKNIKIPLICSGMTGGHDFAYDLNDILSQAVSATGIAMGCGSQRAALEDSNLAETFSIIRTNAADSLIIGNIGAGQVAEGLTVDQVSEIVDMVKADVLAIHFNPLQEAIQPEGDTNLKFLHEKIKLLIQEIKIPVIAKEVGCGFSAEDFSILNQLGFSGVDIQGLGGTSWTGVEAIRSKNVSALHSDTGEVFWDFGNPTSISTIMGVKYFNGTIIGSGGVRNGLDAAKLIALGADAVGMALPFLHSVKTRNLTEVIDFIRKFEYQLRLACFLTGCEKVSDLKRVPLLITGKTAEQLRLLGIDPSEYAKRSGF